MKVDTSHFCESPSFELDHRRHQGDFWRRPTMDSQLASLLNPQASPIGTKDGEWGIGRQYSWSAGTNCSHLLLATCVGYRYNLTAWGEEKTSNTSTIDFRLPHNPMREGELMVAKRAKVLVCRRRFAWRDPLCSATPITVASYHLPLAR